MPIRSKGAYGEELKDNQKENDLIVYQEGKANNTANGNSISGGLDPERDLNPEYLANMDMNTPIHGGNQSFNQYGDDSSPEMQATLGGKNEKYTGEATKNSDVNYNPDIKTGDLNPYYVYGQQSQVYGTLHPGYISQRNDNIASALYNEGRVSKEQVADYLAQQEGWYNSSEADRLNTIESIWKRLGQIAQQNKKEEPAPDMELNNDTSGKIYGKSTAETGEPTEGINTLSDANSVFKAMNESRVANYNALNAMQSSDIAASIDSGTIPYGTQAFRDLQEFNPTKYAEVMAEVKRLRGQDNVNAIASGEDMPANSNNIGSINNDIADFSIKNANGTTSAAEITKNINTMLDENETAQSAQELMGSLESSMAALKNRLKNLKLEAQNAFKGDVPDYLVKAYINNRTQEIQNQLSILEDRYNAAYKRYTTEVSQSQRQQEFDLKKDQLELQQKEFDLKDRATREGIKIDWYKAKNGGTSVTTTNSGREIPVTSKNREEIGDIVDELVDGAYNGTLGNAQCAAGIQKYYFTKLGITIGGLSTFDAKKGLINTEEGYVPQKGDLIIMSSPTQPTYGHIGIVIGVEGGKIKYLDWNGSTKDFEKAAVRTIDADNARIQGYCDVTKGQNNGGDKEWTDYDYTRFEQFRDSTSKSEKEAIASEYNTDLEGMGNIVRDALSNKKEEKGGEDEKGYDEELGYNPYDKETYDQIISDKMTLEEGAKKTGLSEKEMRKRVLNYQEARDKGIDAYDSGTRNVDENYGFVLDKKMVYQTIAKAGGKIPGTQKDTILKELGLNPRDPNAWNKALEETAKWQENQKQELDTQALDSLRAVEYIIMQDANRAQRLLAINGGDQSTWYGAMDLLGSIDRALSGEASSWANSYQYIRDKLTLDYLIDLKNRGATFGALSNQELDAIGNAASLVMYTDETSRFRDNINKLYNELRKALGYEELSGDKLDKMWNAEESGNFDNYITLDSAYDTGWFGKGKYGTQNVKPTRTAGQDLGNRWTEGGDTPSGDGKDILDDVVNG